MEKIAAYRRSQEIEEKRARRICLHCGYSLVGNVSRVCPECGTPVDTLAK